MIRNHATSTIKDAEEVLHDAGWFARADLDPRDLRGILHDLADAGLLATARGRAETTTATDEDAALDAATEAVEAEFTSINAGSDHGARDVAEAAVYAFLGARGLLATARTRPTRDDLAEAIMDSDTVPCDVCDDSRCHYCRADAYRKADAVLALLADQPTEAPTSTQWAHRTASGGASIHPTREAAEAARDEYTSRPVNPFEPPPPASLGIWRREVTPWTKAGDDQ